MPLTINTDIAWVDGDDEVRLYDPATGEFQTLNASAAHVWRGLAAGQDVDHVVTDLVDRFGAGDAHESAAIERDVREFVASLHGQGLLVSSGPAHPGRS